MEHTKMLFKVPFIMVLLLGAQAFSPPSSLIRCEPTLRKQSCARIVMQGTKIVRYWQNRKLDMNFLIQVYCCCSNDVTRRNLLSAAIGVALGMAFVQSLCRCIRLKEESELGSVVPQSSIAAGGNTAIMHIKTADGVEVRP